MRVPVLDIVDKLSNELKVNTECDTFVSSTQLCGIVRAELINCENASLTCTNTGSSTTVIDCNEAQIQDAVVKTVEELAGSSEETAAAVRARLAAAGLDPANYRQSIKDYYSFRCTSNQSARQVALVPRLTLKDCKDVNIDILNSLTQSSVCAAAAIDELVNPLANKQPLLPDVIGPRTPSPVLDAVQITGIVCGVVLLLAILIVVGMRMRVK
jgi:hypothetical protein